MASLPKKLVVPDVRGVDGKMEVYLASDIDAIPKLDLSDFEMRQLHDLIGVVAWIRDLQLHTDKNDFPMELFDGLDKVFCQAQLEACQRLVPKFREYILKHCPEGGLAWNIWPRKRSM